MMCHFPVVVKFGDLKLLCHVHVAEQGYATVDCKVFIQKHVSIDFTELTFFLVQT